MKIPTRINQVIIVNDMEIPQNLPTGFVNAMDSFKTMNPGYEYKLYSGNDCREYIKEHYGDYHLKLFDKLIPYAFKCDFFRLLLILREGGWCDRHSLTCAHLTY